MPAVSQGHFNFMAESQDHFKQRCLGHLIPGSRSHMVPGSLGHFMAGIKIILYQGVRDILCQGESGTCYIRGSQGHFITGSRTFDNRESDIFYRGVGHFIPGSQGHFITGRVRDILYQEESGTFCTRES